MKSDFTLMKIETSVIRPTEQLKKQVMASPEKCVWVERVWNQCLTRASWNVQFDKDEVARWSGSGRSQGIQSQM
jgi:hypothetical protein